MTQLKFEFDVIASPWLSGTRKTNYTTMRLYMKCKKSKWVNGSTSTTATISTKIFAYMKQNGNYVFNHICSAVDLIELPDTEGGVWVRKDSIDVLLPSVEILEESKSKILEDVRFLSKEIKSYTNLVGTKSIEVG